MKKGKKRILGGRRLQETSMSEQLLRQAGDAEVRSRMGKNITNGLETARLRGFCGGRVSPTTSFPGEKVRDTVP